MSKNSIPTTNYSIEEEDNLLEDYINSLKQIVTEFKDQKRNNKQTKDTFFAEYILLEDEILKLIIIIGKNESNQEILEKHINNFNPYWRDFQDEWSEKYW